jgi:hypothetical protein
MLARRRTGMLLKPTLTAPAFLGLAAATRFVVQTTDTRYQVLAYWGLAAALEVVSPVLASPRSPTRWAANATAATLAMVAVRVYLEGIPLRIERLL